VGRGGWRECAPLQALPPNSGGLFYFPLCVLFTLMRCSSCKESKPKTEFYKNNRRCKDCCRAYSREWNKKNLTPERAAEYRSRFAAKNPGYATYKKEEWLEKNPEKARILYEKKLLRDKEKYRLMREAQGKKVGERPPALSHYERKKRYFEKHPIKAECMKIYKYAIRQGKLVRGPCSVCGVTEGVDGHHTDYTKPLDVVWLCKPHHREAHRTCE